MVVLAPAEVARINHDLRLRILEYVLAKGVRPRDLGVTSSLLTKIKHGCRSVSDALLMVALRFLSPDEFRALMGEPETVLLRPDGLKRLSQTEKAFVTKVMIQDPNSASLTSRGPKVVHLCHGPKQADLEPPMIYAAVAQSLERQIAFPSQ